MKRIAILGGGSWGTALAIVLSGTHKPHEISLWVRDEALAESIRRDRENKPYLPGHRLPETVQVAHDAAAVLKEAGAVGYPRRARPQRLPTRHAVPRSRHSDRQRNERAGARHARAHE